MLDSEHSESFEANRRSKSARGEEYRSAAPLATSDPTKSRKPIVA